MARRLFLAWSATAVILVLLAFADTFVFRRVRGIGDFFFFQQDLLVLAAHCLLLKVLADFHAKLRFGAREAPSWWPTAICLAVAATCIAGGRFVYLNYALSMDEFMVNFDAQIFARGKVLESVPDVWRTFVPALQPIFMLEVQGHSHWASAYLPVNAAVRGLARLVGAEAAVGAAWAAVSVAMIVAAARRLWPDQQKIALYAAILLATSAQFLVAAMTPYAMPAHLALNLIWLWCFLRGGVLGHAGSLVTGLFACGLHQVIFHPLFVAPFILQLWLDRRWRLAVLYTGAYGAICLFWVAYWPLVFKMAGVVSSTNVGSSVGADWFTSRITAMLSNFDPVGFGSMAKNLARFLAWQNLLTVPLALLGATAAWRAGGMVRCLALGPVLTVVTMLVLLPYQGHGWGYRYLHGMLGSICLLAAWFWVRMAADGQSADQQGAARVFAAAALGSLLILLPIHLWQVHRQVRPYSLASAAIEAVDADIVLVDDLMGWYMVDLVRNEPALGNRPLVMQLTSLAPAQVRDLCKTRHVRLFDYSDAERYGIRVLPKLEDATDSANLLPAECVLRHVAR